MPRHRPNRTLAVACLMLVAGLGATTASAQVAGARSNLYSQAAVDVFCSTAQQILTGTPGFSHNLVHSSLDSFTSSSAAPYEGPNASAYNGKGSDGSSLPLTTQQLVSHRVLPGTSWEYPIVISCKMKTSEAINYHFGAGSASTQQTCREVNQAIVADVYANLTSIEQRMLRYQQSDIVFTSDFYSGAGPVWLYPLPYLPRVAIVPTTGANAGKLVFIGRALTVERTNPSNDAGPDKKGSYYCHFPSPEYIRALITGQTPPLIENPPEF